MPNLYQEVCIAKDVAWFKANFEDLPLHEKSYLKGRAQALEEVAKLMEDETFFG